VIRAVTILGTFVALAVSAAPVVSAGTSKKSPSGPSKARVGGKTHLQGVSIGAGKDRGWFANLGAANDVSQLRASRCAPW
jgi:hypothetical protein